MTQRHSSDGNYHRDERTAMEVAGAGGGTRQERAATWGPCPFLVEQIVPEQSQGDQREAAQAGLCFMFGRESTGLFFSLSKPF